MKRCFLLSLLCVLFPVNVLALDLMIEDVAQPLTHMTINNPSDAITKRTQLYQDVFGSSGIPTFGNEYDGTCCDGDPAGYFGRNDGVSKWFGFHMENGVRARTMFITFPGSTCLTIINGGHEEGFFPGDPPVNAITKRFAGKPCDIILSSMPLQGENLFARQYLNIPKDEDPHDYLGTFSVTSGSPLKYFLIPAMGTLNYALTQRSYWKVIVIGISGGGWTTTMMAALDPRITNAYAIAGSVPLAYRNPNPEGDWEQYNLPFDYLDIYAMSVAEPGRRSFLIYNGHDSCCFQADEVRPWARPLKERLSAFPGTFGIYMLFSASMHSLQPIMADFIMNDIGEIIN